MCNLKKTDEARIAHLVTARTRVCKINIINAKIDTRTMNTYKPGPALFLHKENTLSFTTIYRCADLSVVSHGTASPVEHGESVWAGRNANLWPSSPHRDSP